MKQTDAILEHLKSGKSLTGLEALNVYQCFRLAARIKDLRAEGYDIKTETIHRQGKIYASYSLNTAPDAYKVQGFLQGVA